MVNERKELTETLGSSAAATTQRRYSAKELGEMMNTHPDQLFNINLEECTDWFANDDYMEEMLSYVKDEKRIDELIEILCLKHEAAVCNRHPKVCYRVTDERKYAPYVDDLDIKLDAMRVRILHKREIDTRLEEMKMRWASTTTDESPKSDNKNENIYNQTTPPAFTANTDSGTIEYRMDDLPEDVRDQILIANDALYAEFVTTLKGPVKNWIDKNRLQDWNVVRFICRLRGLVAKSCSMSIYGRFLEKIGLGNQENNMKQRQDANDKNALIAYDDPNNRKFQYHYLKQDGKKVEELLCDIIGKQEAILNDQAA